MKERIPFPNAPLMPEERRKLKEKGHPKLPGAPHAPYASILLAREENLIPESFEQVGSDLDDFVQAERSTEKRNIHKQRIRNLIQSPRAFEEYIDTLRILQERWTEQADEIKCYADSFLQHIEQYASLGKKPDPKILREWLELAVTSASSKELAERVLRGLYLHATTPEETVDFLYAFALGVLETDNREAFLEGLTILCWGTPVFPRNSKGQINFVKAAFALDDDLLRRQQEIDSVIYVFGSHYVPAAFEKMQQSLDEIGASPEVLNMLDELRKKDFQRMSKLLAFYKRGSGLRKIEPAPSVEWPYSLLFKGGTLRKLFNERIAEEFKQFSSFSLPHSGDLVIEFDPVAIRHVVQEDLRKPPSGTDTFADRNHVASIFYLIPDMPNPEARERILKSLAEENDAIRKKIIQEWVHSISPRGDKMLIVDEELKALGFKSIAFELSEPKTRTVVTVEVEHYKFILELNDDLLIEEYRTGKRLPLSFEQRAFVENVILGHLEELTCTERVLPGAAKETGAALVERQREFTERRGHRRRLPPGRGFTEKQRLAALDERGLDLALLNAKLGLTRETGQITYVKAKEVVRIGAKKEPLISRAPNAMQRYRNIVAKNT